MHKMPASSPNPLWGAGFEAAPPMGGGVASPFKEAKGAFSSALTVYPKSSLLPQTLAPWLSMARG